MDPVAEPDPGTDASPLGSGCVVFNPFAGSADEVTELESAIREDPAMVFCRTDYRGHAAEIAEQAVEDNQEIVVAAGGDGTVSEVVTGLMRAREKHPGRRLPALLIVPLGTGNDLPRTLELPDDPADALALFRVGRRRSLDVIRWDMTGPQETTGGWCINVAAGGFSAKLRDHLTDEIKHTWGPLAYSRAAIASMEELSPHEVTYRCEDTEPRTVTALNVIVANARYAGGGIHVAPSADVSDGLLDLVIVHPGGFVNLATLAARFLAGNVLQSELTEMRRARRIELESDPSMPFNVDGDPVGAGHFTFECAPSALEVIVPAEA